MSSQGLFNFVVFNSLLLFVPASALILWRRPGLWLHLCTFFFGVIIGWFDMKASEVAVPALMLTTFGFFAGFARPQRAWLWVILLGIWVPVFDYIGSSLNVVERSYIELVTSFILPFAFSAGGALAGAAVRRFAAPGETLELDEPTKS